MIFFISFKNSLNLYFEHFELSLKCLVYKINISAKFAKFGKFISEKLRIWRLTLIFIRLTGFLDSNVSLRVCLKHISSCLTTQPSLINTHFSSSPNTPSIHYIQMEQNYGKNVYWTSFLCVQMVHIYFFVTTSLLLRNFTWNYAILFGS